MLKISKLVCQGLSKGSLTSGQHRGNVEMTAEN